MFSEMVDKVVVRTGQAANTVSISDWVNSTLRETASLQLFWKSMVEDTDTVTAIPHLWARPSTFRKMQTVQYPAYNIYPEFLMPGKVLKDKVNYYYANGTYFNFFGEIAVGDTINLAYYTRPRSFKYYKEAARPAVYDEETETWTYLAAYDVSDTTRETARNLVSHWLLQDWEQCILQGSMAKAFASKTDARSATSYSVYKQQQQIIIQDEAFAAFHAAAM